MALMGAAMLTIACSSDDGNQDPCTIEAAFELTLHTVTGALPADTALRVQYGGGVEEYHLDGANTGLKVVECDVDADAASLDSLSCKLWTQGAATVTVTASGFPQVERELEAKKKGECFQTVPVDIVLGDEDAGI
jgi:hypothetical protein